MITAEKSPIAVVTRLSAMLIDHIAMTMVVMLFAIPIFISGFANALEVSHEQQNVDFMSGPLKYLFLFGFALYFCKDVISGRSIAKRLLKLQVVDNKTGRVASPLQCFVRNILCILWIVEVPVAMANTKRRIGDRIAGTALVNYDATLEQPQIKPAKIAFPIIISYSLMLLLSAAMPTLSTYHVPYIASSFNKAESNDLEKAFTKTLGEYGTPDIQVYDSIQNENLKYISIILTLKENYLTDPDSESLLYEQVSNIVYSKFPPATITGSIKYIYRGTGTLITRQVTLGRYIGPTIR